MSLNNFSHELTLFQKIKNYDFILLFCILILGITSIFTMYSTDGGEVSNTSKIYNQIFQ